MLKLQFTLHHASKLLFCCVVVASLSACATLGDDFEQPDVTISSFRAVPAAGAMPSFEIGLRVTNPNSTPLKLRGVAYTIELGGREVVTGVGKDLPMIDAYSEGVFTVTAAASLFAGIRLFTDLMNSPTDNIDYKIVTKLDVGAFIPAIRVKEEGQLSLTGG
jgi:LEA14-like dessication related protein